MAMWDQGVIFVKLGKLQNIAMLLDPSRVGEINDVAEDWDNWGNIVL